MSKEAGIDFGTTNTVVCYKNQNDVPRFLRYKGKNSRVVNSAQQAAVIPSVVYFLSENDCIIGYEAKRKLSHNPKAGAANFKPHIGDREKITIEAENGDTFELRPREVASIFLNRILRELDDTIRRQSNTEVGGVVITVPAKFNDKEKAAVKKAARDADFADVRLATEPTAAAVAAISGEKKEGENGNILVYDFGGGTFDVSVIQKRGRKYIEIATGGDKKLGGNVLTECLAQYLFAMVEDEFGIEMPYDENEFDEEYSGISYVDYLKNRMAILDAANIMKEELSEDETAVTAIDLILPNGPVLWDCEVSREIFEKMIRPYIDRTVCITADIIREAGERGCGELDQIVLAGGSSQIPLVQRLMWERYGSKSRFYAEDVYNLIARGAAVLASKELDDVTEPITNIQYGVAVTEGEAYKQFQPVILEDQPLPCRGSRRFCLGKDGQTRIEIPYFERDIKTYPNAKRTDDDGISEIDTIIVSNLPEKLMKRDEVEVNVEFCIQRDGTLDVNVDILDKNGNSIRSAEIKSEKISNLE